MTTPQQFLESFFREKVTIYNDANARLLPVYAKYFGEMLLKHSGDFLLLNRMREVIDDVKEWQAYTAMRTSIKSDVFLVIRAMTSRRILTTFPSTSQET